MINKYSGVKLEKLLTLATSFQLQVEVFRSEDKAGRGFSAEHVNAQNELDRIWIELLENRFERICSSLKLVGKGPQLFQDRNAKLVFAQGQNKFEIMIWVLRKDYSDIYTKVRIRKMNVQFQTISGFMDELTLAEAIAVYFRFVDNIYPDGMDGVDTLADPIPNMRLDLWKIAQEALHDATFMVNVKNVVMVGGYESEVQGWDAAWEEREVLENRVKADAQGPYHSTTWFETAYGTFYVPTFGKNYFVPKRSASSPMSDTRFQEIISRPDREKAEIERLWEQIVNAYAKRQVPEEFFEFQGETYSISLGSNRFSRDWAGIRCLFANGVDRNFLPYLRNGMLVAWAEFVSPEAVAARKEETQRKLERAYEIVNDIRLRLLAMDWQAKQQRQPRYNGERINIPEPPFTCITWGYNGFVSLVDLLDDGTLQRWLDELKS